MHIHCTLFSSSQDQYPISSHRNMFAVLKLSMSIKATKISQLRQDAGTQQMVPRNGCATNLRRLPKRPSAPSWEALPSSGLKVLRSQISPSSEEIEPMGSQEKTQQNNQVVRLCFQFWPMDMGPCSGCCFASKDSGKVVSNHETSWMGWFIQKTSRGHGNSHK